jgi:alkanesulfonate monooxygenase SsuD/methylene tetrahydromethanopterin reductase-like flavin-dependent oxidoreductase (luciferase family)
MATNQPDTWRIAGEVGAGVLAFGFNSPAQLHESIAIYRKAIAEAETPYGMKNDQILFAPCMFCHEDEKTALETAAPAVRFFIESNLGYVTQWADGGYDDYRYYTEIGKEFLKLPELTEEESAGLSPDACMIKAGRKAGMFCVGTPEQCREVVEVYRDAGVDQLSFVCQVGSLTDEQIRGSLELFAAKVAPHFASDTASGRVSTPVAGS